MLANKHTSLSAFWVHVGLPKDILPPKPRFEQGLPTICEMKETSRILAVADERLRLVIKVIDQTGLREREVMHVGMDAINQRVGTLRVRGIPKYRFRIKTCQQRDIPITSSLVEELARWHKDHPHDLLFPTTAGKPDGHFLRSLKQRARRGGLNCGKCEGCNLPTQECGEWTLHKWRRTFITRCLRENFDLRTVQLFAGHKNMQATVRYLRPCSAAEVQQRFNLFQ